MIKIGDILFSGETVIDVKVNTHATHENNLYLVELSSGIKIHYGNSRYYFSDKSKHNYNIRNKIKKTGV